MPFPEDTSHFRRWLLSEKALNASLEAVHADAVARWRTKVKNDSLRAKLDAITADDCRVLVAYYVRQLLFVCTTKKLDYRVCATAVSFLTRFYLKRSPIDHDVLTILLTCIILAVKCEEMSTSLPMARITEELLGEGKISLKQVLDNELVVLDAIGFDLLILHVRTPLHYLTTAYYQSRKSLVPPDQLATLDAQMVEINAEAEKLSFDCMVLNLHFIYSPAQIAVGVFRHVSENRLPKVDAFIASSFRSEPRSYAMLLIAIQHIRAQLDEYKRTEDERNATVMDRVGPILKTIEKLTARRKRGKKEKRASKGDPGKDEGGSLPVEAPEGESQRNPVSEAIDSDNRVTEIARIESTTDEKADELMNVTKTSASPTGHEEAGTSAEVAPAWLNVKRQAVEGSVAKGDTMATTDEPDLTMTDMVVSEGADNDDVQMRQNDSQTSSGGTADSGSETQVPGKRLPAEQDLDSEATGSQPKKPRLEGSGDESTDLGTSTQTADFQQIPNNQNP